MNITAIFLLACCLQVSARVGSQGITINVKNTTLNKVFQEIKKQTGYTFIYTETMLKESRKVSMNVKNSPLQKVLSICFATQPFTYKIINQTVIVQPKEKVEVNTNSTLTLPSPPPPIEIHGKVVNQKGEPLQNVSVLITGTKIGTTTDKDGRFTLSVPNNRNIELEISIVGYQTKRVKVTGQIEINVTLELEVTGLSDVVVVGYGTQKKVNLVGAVSAVKVDQKLESRSLQNVSSGLEGLVPGLAVNQSTGMAGNNQANLIIRGLGTVNNSSPLIVVDGMPDVDLNRINMNDIESISVLKDATSAAVYGSRAANGVILITTKSGKGKNGTSINFTGSYAVEHPTKSYKFMADYPRALTVEQKQSAVNTLPSNQTFKNGTIDQWMALGMIDPLQYPNTDWWSLIMRDGSLQNYNLSASGGNDKSNFYISVGTKKEDGLQINNNYSQYNARFNYDYKLKSNMNVGVRFYGDWSNYLFAKANGYTDDDPSLTGGFPLQAAIAGITPYDPVTGYYGGVMAYNEDPQAYNPYTEYQNKLNHQNRQEANASVYWDWTPVKGLTARVDYALTYYNQFLWKADIPNQAYNFQTHSFGSRVYVGDNAEIGNFTNTGYKTMMTGQLHYQKTIAQHHDISALFVYSEEYWYDRSQASSRNGRLYPTLHEVDAALTDIQGTGGNSSDEGLRSYIGRLNYTAFDKYLFEADFRYDGSSKFLPGSQFSFFPSVAAGWRFSQEDFMKNLTGNFLSNGKFRVSYGGLGNNSGVGRYGQQETLAANNYIIDGGIVKGFVNSKMVNRDLSWETTTVLNFGLDLGFLNNRLTASLDYYNRLTTGMLRPSDLSILLTGAYDAPRKNIGNLRNRGVEADITWNDNIGNLHYNLSLNASYNKTTLEKWNEYLGRGDVFLNMPYNFVYTYEDAGIAQTWQDVYNATPQGASPGDILRKDLNGDGSIDGNDTKAYPNFQRARPTTTFALNTAFSWRGIDLAILFQGSAGRKNFWLNDYNQVNFSLQRYASSWGQWYNPWSLDNRDGEWPRLGGSNNHIQTSFWLDDMSFLRLKNIQLGYKLPQSLIHRIHINSLRIFGSAENIATFTSYRGLDPEITGNANNAYPLTKSYSIGVNMGL